MAVFPADAAMTPSGASASRRHRPRGPYFVMAMALVEWRPPSNPPGGQAVTRGSFHIL